MNTEKRALYDFGEIHVRLLLKECYLWKEFNQVKIDDLGK